MSQRDSGYERKERDLYETPEWVTRALVPHIPARVRTILEPAAATGKMVRALQDSGYRVFASDIDQGYDFLATHEGPAFACDAIITNPPYKHACSFIHRAMTLMEPDGCVAMLLRTDFDHAASRTEMFSDDPKYGEGASRFLKKVVLTRRIKWFEDSKGSPSFNHAWFIWDWQHKGPPTLAYGP